MNPVLRRSAFAIIGTLTLAQNWPASAWQDM